MTSSTVVANFDAGGFTGGSGVLTPQAARVTALVTARQTTGPAVQPTHVVNEASVAQWGARPLDAPQWLAATDTAALQAMIDQYAQPRRIVVVDLALPQPDAALTAAVASIEPGDVHPVSVVDDRTATRVHGLGVVRSVEWLLGADAIGVCRVTLQEVLVSTAAGGGAYSSGYSTAYDRAGSTPTNQPPVANAGPDRSGVAAGAMVTLDGSASFDPDGSIASYAWSQTAGTTVALSSVDAVSPSFTAPSPGPETLTFELTVTDNNGATDTDTVNIAIAAGPANQPPVASAGPDQSGIAGGATVTLDGSGSTDPDGSIASYAWSQTAGSSVTLVDADTASPSFTAPSETTAQTLTFELTVTDNNGATDTDTVNIAVRNGSPRDRQPTYWHGQTDGAVFDFRQRAVQPRPRHSPCPRRRRRSHAHQETACDTVNVGVNFMTVGMSRSCASSWVGNGC